MLYKYFSSFAVSIPFMISMLGMYFSYNVHEEVYLFLPLIVSFLCLILFDKKIQLRLQHNLSRSHEKIVDIEIVATLLGIIVIFFGLIDLYLHGIVFFHPETYATFTPIEARVRHFSSLCWILIPISLTINLNKILKYLFFIWAIVFPIVTVDRNRLLLVICSICLTFFFSPQLHSIFKKYFKLILALSLSIGTLLFITIGNKRVGVNVVHNLYGKSPGHIPLEKDCRVPESLPIKEEIKKMPPGFQWIFLYVTSPIYNLTIQYKCNVNDKSILLAQIIPLWKKYKKVAEPFLVNRALNVGTELLPFLLAFGITGLFIAVFLEYFLLKMALNIYLNTGNIFDLIILLRLSYCALMTGFAPQFFTWTTFGLVILLKTIQFFMQLRIFKHYFEKLQKLSLKIFITH